MKISPTKARNQHGFLTKKKVDGRKINRWVEEKTRDRRMEGRDGKKTTSVKRSSRKMRKGTTGTYIIDSLTGKRKEAQESKALLLNTVESDEGQGD